MPSSISFQDWGLKQSLKYKYKKLSPKLPNTYIFFPVQLTTSRIDNLTRLILTLLLDVITIYIHADTTKGPWEDPGICDESGLV